MHHLALILLIGLTGRSLCAGNEEKPTIYDLQFGNKLAENQRFHLTCLVSTGGQESAIEWFLNGQKVVQNENVLVNQLEDGSMLNIRQMRLELAGEYECRVANRFGRDARKISVKLEGKWDQTVCRFKKESNRTLSLNQFRIKSQAKVFGRTNRHSGETELAALHQMPNHWTAHSDHPMGETLVQWFVQISF